MAARVVGVSTSGILFRHLLPNIMSSLAVLATFGVASAIILEAGLSFLGLGVKVPVPSWGEMINAAQSPTVLIDTPWLWISPGHRDRAHGAVGQLHRRRSARRPGSARGPSPLRLGRPSPEGPLLYSGRARPCDRMSGAAPTMNLRPLTVAVVGATGVVGRTMIQILNEREFPVGELRLLASGRSAGRTVSIDGRTLEIAEAVPDAFEGVDIALFSAGADISTELAPAAVARGATVIDNSSAWRMDPTIPLVVSQVNPDDLEGHPGIVANPNCSTMQLAPVLMALRDTVGLERVVVDTYQSVSGTGADALAELEGQIRAHVTGEPRWRTSIRTRSPSTRCPRSTSSCPTATRRRSGRSSPRAARSSTSRSCGSRARPCASRSSSATRRRSTSRRASRSPRSGPASCSRRSRASSSRTTPPTHDYPLATEAAGRDEIFVGRVRRDISIADDRGLAFWVVSDNLRKGAATNAVELAEALRERDWIKPAAARGATAVRGIPRGHGVTDVERRTALEEIAAEVRVCTNCRLHQTRTKAVPGEGDPDTEVVFVGEGPGFNEDREGRPFIGRAGDLLVKLLASIGWRREDVFITNVVKCRPPDNRDPQPDEIAACAPYLRRQLEVLDPAVVVTLGRFSMGTFMPGARISQAHGTVRPVDPATGARAALVFAMYHPAAALRTPAIERERYADIAAVPAALLDSRRRREAAVPPTPAATDAERPDAASPRRRAAATTARRARRPRNPTRLAVDADPGRRRRRPPN